MAYNPLYDDPTDPPKIPIGKSKRKFTAENITNPGKQTEVRGRIINRKAKKILASKPTFDIDYANNRREALKQFTPQELTDIKRSNLAHKVEPSL